MEFYDGERVLVLSFGELWLRGKNRGTYLRMLRENLSRQLEGESYTLENEYDRFVIRLSKDSDMGSIKAKLSRLFGLSNFSVCSVTSPNLKAITAQAKKLLKEVPEGRKILRINSHRSFKGFKFNSIDIIKSISKAAKAQDFTLSTHGFLTDMNISVTKDAAFVSCEKVKGMGGLPVRSSGKGVVLLSGGIDSPVAAWYAMKRGIEPIYIHVHAYQDAQEALGSKVPKLIDMLSGYYPDAKTYYVPSYILQSHSLKSGKYELILLKAFMLKLAEKIAKKEGAGAIITGESLGQVASQTLQNITAEEQGIKMPILRPLIGYDKNEIILVARTIGTYEESIKPYKDVCSINAKNPSTAAPTAKIKELSRSIRLGSIVSRSMRLATVTDRRGK